MVECDVLVRYLDELLGCASVKDYCPNGLQVEGRPRVGKIVGGVTASLALIEAAIAHQADALLVHHGYFWRGEAERIVGMKRRRLATLLGQDLNLLAYHLPLDLHDELGNNAQLGKVLGWYGTGRFGEQGLGWLGEPDHPVQAGVLARSVAARLGRVPVLVGDEARLVRTVAWCSGGAQGLLEAAIEAGADLFLSGEISEQTTHIAREAGVAYLAAGHHATERYGVQALGAHLARCHGVAFEFVDIPNPA